MRYALVLLALSAVACTAAPSVTTSPLSPAPVVPSGPSLATVTIVAFTVTETHSGSRIAYAPQIQLAETSGRSAATLTDVSFEVHGGGRSGFLPGARRIPAGGTLQVFSRNEYGEYELEMDSAIDAVNVFFTDDEGRIGSVRAVVSPWDY